MKVCVCMKKLIFFSIILFIVSISAVSASDNITDSALDETTDNVLCKDADVVLQNDSEETVGNIDYPEGNILGEVDSNSSNNNSGGNDSSGEVDGNSSNNNSGANNSSGVTNSSGGDKKPVTPVTYKIKADTYVWHYASNPVYKFKIVDSKGKAAANKKVSLIIKGKTYKVTTDKKGNGKLKLNLKAGNYTVKIKFASKTVTKKIKLFKSRIRYTKNLSSTYGSQVQYVLKIVDKAAKPMPKAKVKFTVGDKVYYKNTNKKGIARLNLNFNSGYYTIKYSVKGLTGTNKYTVKNKVVLYVLRWGLTGDVSHSGLIKSNMPNNVWIKKIVAATREGVPLLTIKGGPGKVAFMTAGVHGNELNSQVAAMKMIDYLTTHPIKGTVHIVPFVNVKAISQKVRLTNYDFNRVAHRTNTVSNNLMNMMFRLKCDYYGDFHTTVSPGVPGINVVLGYTTSSVGISLTNYIANNAKVNKIFYYAGEKYRWSLADWSNYKGTPAVICEVISPVNVVSAGATNLSFKQMTYFLKFGSII